MRNRCGHAWQIPIAVFFSTEIVSAGGQRQSFDKAAAATTKARVEAGEGVPFFDERFSCREDDGVWADYRELVQYARLRIFGDGEGSDLYRLLSATLAARTKNVTEILQCNVGVIAGYHLLARRNVAESDDWKAYRLLQLALIYVFTLRNALQIPAEAGHDWATRTDQIVQEIKLLRTRLVKEQVRRIGWLPEVPPSLRIPSLRIAIVSICAYPKDHPLVLKDVTPENRRLYAERHGYSLHMHMTHPMPRDGIHVQHAKLSLVASYLRMGLYDWVAWFDCDSIIMNLDKSLDSIIYRYARRRARPHAQSIEKVDRSNVEDQTHAENSKEKPTGLESEDFTAEGSLDEPDEDEELEAYVYHIGSCNTEVGCNASSLIRVNRRVHYTVTVSTALIDMDLATEKLASVVVGGKELGECNPMPESDYDCGYHDCFQEEEVPLDAYAKSGFLLLQAHAVKTHSDCRCSRLQGFCYSSAIANLEEATNGEKTTEPSYGMFVRFTLTPHRKKHLTDNDPVNSIIQEQQASDIIELEECSCRERSRSRNHRSLSALLFDADNYTRDNFKIGNNTASVRRLNAECNGQDVLLGLHLSLEECLQICREINGCRYVTHGYGKKLGQCYWEINECDSFEQDTYIVYDVSSDSAANFPDCSRLCIGYENAQSVPETSHILDEPELRTRSDKVKSDGELPAGDDGVDLLITEEGWGLSSANWMIRSSAWSISFLERAFALCHKDMPLFGDQDAMIHLLLNPNALQHDHSGDPLDPHAVIIPQRELNAYDALNAHYMGCDGFEDGDLLVTFPGCKEPQACNPLFELAAQYAVDRDNRTEGERVELEATSLAHLRLFGPADVAAKIFSTARKQGGSNDSV